MLVEVVVKGHLRSSNHRIRNNYSSNTNNSSSSSSSGNITVTLLGPVLDFL